MGTIPLERRLLLIVPVLFWGPAGLGVVQAADLPVFRSDVALVRVEAQVLDRDNHPITGLGPEDLIVRDGGKLRKIQSVDSEKMPVDLVLLLDVSASMRPYVERRQWARRCNNCATMTGSP